MGGSFMKFLNSLKLPASRSLISIKQLSWGFTLQLMLNFGRAYIQPKSSIPIGGKVEIGSKGFTLWVNATLEKIFSICPKLLLNAELYELVLAPKAGKRIPSNLGGQFATLGAKQQAKNAWSWPQVFLGPDS
jgi:hypothetical protein